MPANREPSDRRSGEPKVRRPDAPSTDGRAIGGDADTSALDQTASDTDQTLSDADQTLSDADQAAAEQDQATSDSDQRSADRDQAASDRFSATHPTTDPKLRQAYAASEQERARSTSEREAATELRSINMYDRFEHAAKRDEKAARRDADAILRDRTAELRDKATHDHEVALGQARGYTVRARGAARTDRERAAEDRLRAAEDRRRAADDRKHARANLETAQLDELTGFYRRALGQAVLQREIDRSRRGDGRLVMAYCDVDGLKQRNDEEGHAAGDELLRGFANSLRSRLRSYDPVVRMGGDEFVCALSNSDLDEAKRVFEDVRHEFASIDGGGSSVTVGFAAMQADETLAALMQRSDEACRAAKPAG